ncbi:MAG: PilZ domain-containing protein [Candidatus Coatesbacteria bacterium]|nr:PilZ domain-containing protein [Candidatus Coatesbacteria bacterium]
MTDSMHTDFEQHRSYFRREMAIAVSAELFALPDGSELPDERVIPVETVNVSGGGMLLMATRKSPTTDLISVGTLIDVSIPSSGSVVVTRLLARVVRLERPTPNELRFALEFILISPKEADTIVRIVML